MAAAVFLVIPITGLWAAVSPNAPPPGLWTWVLCAYLVTHWSELRRGSWTLLGLFGLVGISAWLWAGVDPSAAIQHAGLIAALMGALALMGKAAEESPDITMAARYLTSQAPQNRYLALTLGTHLLSVLLNFGAVLVMTSLLAKGRDQLAPPLVIRSTLAILRGFAGMPFWSPLALSVVITISVLPDVAYLSIFPAGLAFAATYMAIGALMDAGQGRAEPAPLRPVVRARSERVALWRVALRAALLLGVSLGLVSAGSSVVAAVLVASVTLASLWLGVQWCADARAVTTATIARAGGSMVNETAIVAGAAFAGATIVSALQSLETSAPVMSVLVTAVVASVLPWLMVAGGALALNPIITGSLFLGVLQSAWPAAAINWLALAVIFGWGITAGGTPFTANVLIAARIVRRPGAMLTYRDNAALTLTMLIIASLTIAVGVLVSA